MPEPPRVARLDDLPAASIIDGTITWRPVRRELGIGAFGINAYTAARAGGDLIEDHDETGGASGRHEELYVVLRGHARFTVDGEEIDAPAGPFVFVGDRTSRRSAVAVADDTAALVVGGVVGEAFRSSPWEGSALAAAFAQQGDFGRALTLAREAISEHGDNGGAVYNAACAEALAGDRAAALEHLLRAIELDPRCAEWAKTDADLDPIRDDAEWGGWDEGSGS
jgi:tetratricopeptide (TPR) repeat protein